MCVVCVVCLVCVCDVCGVRVWCVCGVCCVCGVWYVMESERERECEREKGRLCAGVRACVRACVWCGVCMRLCEFVCMRLYVCVCALALACIVCMHVCACVCICVHMCVHVCVSYVRARVRVNVWCTTTFIIGSANTPDGSNKVMFSSFPSPHYVLSMFACRAVSRRIVLLLVYLDQIPFISAFSTGTHGTKHLSATSKNHLKTHQNTSFKDTSPMMCTIVDISNTL